MGRSDWGRSKSSLEVLRLPFDVHRPLFDGYFPFDVVLLLSPCSSSAPGRRASGVRDPERSNLL